MSNQACITSSPAAPLAVGSTRDRDLAARLRARDTAALREVMDRHAAGVHRMARSIVADAGVVEEIAQDVFVALWDRPERFDPTRAGLGTYLIALARNKAIDKLRSYHVRQRTVDSLTAVARSAPLGSSSEHQVELRTSLVPLIEALPQTHREALVLAFYGGRTYKQVAQELDIPEGTAKTRLRQALRSLREVLQDTGPALGAA